METTSFTVPFTLIGRPISLLLFCDTVTKIRYKWLKWPYLPELIDSRV